MGKLVIFSAPSGSGKTTIVRELLKRFPQFEFSISATSRKPRGQEQHGVDYYFMTNEEFKAHVESDDFVEWEEVYQGTCYGTLKAEMNRIWDNGHVILFDVDVMGGIINIEQASSPKRRFRLIPPITSTSKMITLPAFQIRSISLLSVP